MSEKGAGPVELEAAVARAFRRPIPSREQIEAQVNDQIKADLRLNRAWARKIELDVELGGGALHLELVGTIHKKRLREALARSIPHFRHVVEGLDPAPITWRAEGAPHPHGVLEPGAVLIGPRSIMRAWSMSQFGTPDALEPVHLRRLAVEHIDHEIREGFVSRMVRGHMINGVVRAYFGLCDQGYEHATNCARSARGVCAPCTRFLESRGEGAAPQSRAVQMGLFGLEDTNG